VSLNKVGYWTDNGASYYYRTADGMNYEQTLMAIKRDFERAGIQPGYIQLDSWFYPKGKVAMWDNNERSTLPFAVTGRLARMEISPGTM